MLFRPPYLHFQHVPHPRIPTAKQTTLVILSIVVFSDKLVTTSVMFCILSSQPTLIRRCTSSTLTQPPQVLNLSPNLRHLPEDNTRSQWQFRRISQFWSGGEPSLSTQSQECLQYVTYDICHQSILITIPYSLLLSSFFR